MKMNKRGEVATLITILTLAVIGASTLVSSIFLSRSKQTTKTKAAALPSCNPATELAKCSDPNWYCGCECADNTVRNIFKGTYPPPQDAAAIWRSEKARNCGFNDANLCATSTTCGQGAGGGGGGAGGGGGGGACQNCGGGGTGSCFYITCKVDAVVSGNTANIETHVYVWNAQNPQGGGSVGHIQFFIDGGARGTQWGQWSSPLDIGPYPGNPAAEPLRYSLNNGQSKTATYAVKIDECSADNWKEVTGKVSVSGGKVYVEGCDVGNNTAKGVPPAASPPNQLPPPSATSTPTPTPAAGGGGGTPNKPVCYSVGSYCQPGLCSSPNTCVGVYCCSPEGVTPTPTQTSSSSTTITIKSVSGRLLDCQIPGPINNKVINLIGFQNNGRMGGNTDNYGRFNRSNDGNFTCVENDNISILAIRDDNTETPPKEIFKCQPNNDRQVVNVGDVCVDFSAAGGGAQAPTSGAAQPPTSSCIAKATTLQVGHITSECIYNEQPNPNAPCGNSQLVYNEKNCRIYRICDAKGAGCLYECFKGAETENCWAGDQPQELLQFRIVNNASSPKYLSKAVIKLLRIGSNIEKTYDFNNSPLNQGGEIVVTLRDNPDIQLECSPKLGFASIYTQIFYSDAPIDPDTSKNSYKSSEGRDDCMGGVDFIIYLQ